jgi:hydroxymethylbilane synthase
MRIATRGSALALAQAELVAGLLGGAEIVPIETRGDRSSAAAEDAISAAQAPAVGAAAAEHARGGDKSRWVAELEQALLDGRAEIAVHSAKDLPTQLAEGLVLLGAPSRAPAEDVLRGVAELAALPRDARVGTSSLRRLAQLRAHRSDVDVVPLHGNVDTRLRKLAEPAQRLDAIVLARAGLVRLAIDSSRDATLDPRVFVPAPGQGALAIEGRRDDAGARAAVAAINDDRTLAALLAERAVARELQADCDTPLGAHAVATAEDGLLVHAWLGLPDGSAYVADELEGRASKAEEIGASVAARMIAAGAGELLARIRQESAGGG